MQVFKYTRMGVICYLLSNMCFLILAICFLLSNYQAQFQLASSSKVKLRAEISLIISVRSNPGKYIWAPSRLPWKLKFGMEALFNQTKSNG